MWKMRRPLLHLVSTVLTANLTKLQKPQEYVNQQYTTTVWLTVIKYLH